LFDSNTSLYIFETDFQDESMRLKMDGCFNAEILPPV